MELASGAVVDRYTIDAKLGEGGMAVVYRCVHNQLGTMHAVKLLTVSSRSITERLLQEGRVQATLRHRNIVSVTDVIDVNGQPGLVMEYIGGPSLDELLVNRTLTIDQADELVRAILTGVAHAHDQGLVHRDLKPANIMLDVAKTGLVPKVADFGLAKILGDDAGLGATRSGMTMGTPSYMAPEQIRDSKRVDARTDVFALGVILYEMLASGRRPFEGEDVLDIFKAIDEGTYAPLSAHRDDVPQRMIDAIDGALVRDRDERFGDVHQLLAVWTGEKKADEVGPVGPWGDDLLEQAASLGSMSTPLSSGGSTGAAAMTTGGATVSWGHADSFVKDNEREPTSETYMVDVPEEPSGSLAPMPAAPVETPDPGSDSIVLPKRTVGLGVAAVGVIGLLVGLVGLGIGATVLFAPAEPEPEPVAAPEPAPVTVAETPKKKATSKAKETSKAAKVEANAAPEAKGKKAKSKKVRPAARTPAPEPEPEVVVPEVVVPEPEPEPEPAPPPAPATNATVVVSGQVESVWLQNASGNFPAGKVPPGTYKVRAFWDGQGKTVAEVTLSAGDTLALTCNAFKTCKVKK